MPSESFEEKNDREFASLTPPGPRPGGTPVRRTDQELVKELVVLLRARQRAADDLEERAAAALGVHRTAARCVEILLGESPLSAGELAERVGVSRSGTTPLLDRLEDAGVIQRRRASDEDRRRVAIELTTVGRTIAQQFWDGVFQRLTRLAQQYSREDLEVVQDFLTRANAILSGSEPPPRMERQPDAPSVPRSGHVGNPQQARPPTLAIERRAALGRRGPTLGSQSDAEQAPG